MLDVWGYDAWRTWPGEDDSTDFEAIEDRDGDRADAAYERWLDREMEDEL